MDEKTLFCVMNKEPDCRFVTWDEMKSNEDLWDIAPRRISQHTLRPTHVVVNLQQIVLNYRILKAHCQKPVMAVIKADAYGHGIVEVAKVLEQEGAPYFGVAYLEEALLLREEGIQTPILVMGGILGEQIPLYIRHNITLTASSVDKLKSIEACAKEMGKNAIAHLKIDTGMERIGVHDYSAATILEVASQCRHVQIEGIFTHFANSDAVKLDHTQMQCTRFESVLEIAQQFGLEIPLRHLANSAAVVRLPQSYGSMVRAGIMIYGVYPSLEVPRLEGIKPAMTWRSNSVFFKVVQPGRPVGYGSKWVSDKMTRIVTVPVGYGDGYHRVMSGKAEVLIRGKRYPVVGSICMDQIMINIGWDEVYNGEEVVLLGAQGSNEVSVDELADWAQTNPYEILTSINLRVTRVHV